MHLLLLLGSAIPIDAAASCSMDLQGSVDSIEAASSAALSSSKSKGDGNDSNTSRDDGRSVVYAGGALSELQVEEGISVTLMKG